MLAGLDASVLEDVSLMGLEQELALVLAGRGWTTTFVDRAFQDPSDPGERGVGRLFPFIEVDPVDARLIPGIERDQIAVAGQEGAAVGKASGEVSLVHVARGTRPGSTVLSNASCAVALGRRRGVPVRGTLCVVHRAYRAGLLTQAEARDHYARLVSAGRPTPMLTRSQLDEYLATGEDPRG